MGNSLANGDCNVRNVVDKLHRPLAYTTIMTTLDRLYKKGSLDCRREARIYCSARLSHAEWERARVYELVAGFSGRSAAASRSARFLFASTPSASTIRNFAELERKIRSERRKLRAERADDSLVSLETLLLCAAIAFL